MSKQYKQLNQEERNQIYLLLRQGKTQKEIALALKRDKSTISRELSQNKHRKFNEYLPDTAQRKSIRKKTKGRKQQYVDKYPEVKEYILEKLELGWSPEQIAGRMFREINRYLNQESIYQYIYRLPGRKQNLKQYLRRSHRIRHKKKGRKHQKGKIPNRVDIALRPKEVDKLAFGHWEGDTMYYRGHQQTLATHLERRTGRILAVRPTNKSALSRSRAMMDELVALPQPARKTMTLDNGLENSEHQRITERIGTQIYFAKPYASYQRARNENGNGLIRWYLPKTTNLDNFTNQQIQDIIELINNRPRKRFGFLTPNEMFEIEMSKLKLKGPKFSHSFNHFFSHSVALAN